MKTLFLLLIGAIFLLSGQICSYAAEEEKDTLIDVMMKPVKILLAPVKKGDLIDLIKKPAKAAVMPLFELGDIASTAGRTREYIYNVNKNVSVIDLSQIENVNPRDLQQMLELEAGVEVHRFFNNTKDNNVDIRGFGETGLLNYVLLVDGRRTNQVDLSGADISQIDVNSIERIEILRGGNSVLYGDNATGGVINIITRKGRKGDHIEYRQEFGSYRYHKEYISVEGGHDFLDYFLSYSNQDSDGYRLNGAYEANDIFASVTFRPDDFMDVRVTSGYHKDWYGQPGALYDGNIQSIGRRGSRFPNSKAKTEDWYITALPSIYGKVGNHEGIFSFLVSYRLRRSNARDVGFNVYETNHHIGTLELKPKFEINSLLLDEALENKLVFGIDYYRTRDRILSGDVAFTKSQLDMVKETFGIYASDNLMINKRFILSGGVRGEWARYLFDQVQPANSYNTSSLKEAAFNAGLGYKYNEKSQVYANGARAYRFPATDELFQSAYETFDWWTFTNRVFPAVLNSGLKQQVGNNYEIGVKDNSFDFLRFKAAYYLMDTKNEIYYDPIFFANQNYHQTIRHGFELEAEAAILDKITGFFRYTFQKAFFVGGKFASKNVPLVPRDKVTGGFNVKLIEPLNINCEINYIGSQWIASDQMNNVSKLKSHVTVDAGVSFDLKNIRFFGTVRNLLNEKYYLNATKNWQGNPAFYPASEMGYEWGVSLKF